MILGATAIDLEDGFLSMVRSASRGGALAVSTDLLGADARVRDEVVRVLKRGLTEVTVWGTDGRRNWAVRAIRSSTG